MLADPQVITIATIANTLNRISTGDLKSVYQTADGNRKLTISHQTSKGRTRRMARIDTKAVVADPLSAVNDYEQFGVYVVIDEPEFGFSDQTIADVIAGFFAWYNADMVAKVLGSQS